jgi:hypothetical protein
MRDRIYYSALLRRGGHTAPSYDETQRDLRDALRRTVPTELPR